MSAPNAEAWWRALSFLEQAAQDLTVEQAQAEAERWRGSQDVNEELLSALALEAAQILALLKCSVCGQPVRRPRPDDGLAPDEFEWTHASGNPICGGAPVAYPGP